MKDWATYAQECGQQTCDCEHTSFKYLIKESDFLQHERDLIEEETYNFIGVPQPIFGLPLSIKVLIMCHQ